MRSARDLAALLIACALIACGRSAPGPSDSPAPATGLLIDGRGVPTTLAKAVRQISFRPVLPVPDPLAIAVIPPLGNQDTIATRGIAFEYDANGISMLLSEWPAQNFRIAFRALDATASPCTIVRYMHDGVVWTTPHGVVMSLQPDGEATIATVRREAQALLARGACRY